MKISLCKGAHGSHWADPTIHPTVGGELDGWYAIYVDILRMGGALTPEQRTRVVTLTADWFAT